MNGPENRFTVDFVASGEAPDEWRMVLVEAGPWDEAVEDRLRALQSRLYGCLEAALGGQLANAFPGSHGKTVIIQVDCYDGPQQQIAAFMTRFSQGALTLPNIRARLEENPFVRGVRFKLNLLKISTAGSQD